MGRRDGEVAVITRAPILPQRDAVELLTVFLPQQRDGSDEVG